MKNVKKFISLVLIVTMVTLNLPLTVFAGENEALNRFKEYNKEKVSLYPYLVEMYKSGSETSVGPSQLGRLTGESFNYTIYTLYFENDKLVDWTEQNYTS